MAVITVIKSFRFPYAASVEALSLYDLLFDIECFMHFIGLLVLIISRGMVSEGRAGNLLDFGCGFFFFSLSFGRWHSQVVGVVA